MYYAGIDYSMSSPALCIGQADSSIEECLFFQFTTPKKTGTYKNVTCWEYPQWNTQEERFELLAAHFLEVLIEYDVQFVWIEDYAFAAKGKVFHIGENGGVLKNKLWQQKFEYKQISPPSIKKFATGKGNQKKDDMYQAWLQQGGRDINSDISPKSKSIGSPANDIVDAYFIMKTGLSLRG